jgi:hypothetical protein
VIFTERAMSLQVYNKIIYGQFVSAEGRGCPAFRPAWKPLDVRKERSWGLCSCQLVAGGRMVARIQESHGRGFEPAQDRALVR